MNSKIEVFNGDLSSERLAQHLGACDAYNEELDITGALSVDCEMMGLNPNRDRLCLVQICDDNKNVSLVRISQGQTEAKNLKILLENPKIEKIFHFARADVAFLWQFLGIAVNPVFCTKIASKIARTYTDSHGLKNIVKEFLGIELNKYQQSSDWGREDLSPDQISYAAGDVLYLHEIKERLLEMLERESRLELAQECFQQINLMARLDLMGYEFIFEHNSPNRK